MPTYEYQCTYCGHELEEFHSISEPPHTHCPKCGTENLIRIMGTGAGLIFRGSGFYLTDYKKGSSPGGSDGSPKKSKEKEPAKTPDPPAADKGKESGKDPGTPKSDAGTKP